MGKKTLRDEFAMAALTGLLACSMSERPSWWDDSDVTGGIARRAYQYADAMIVVRKQKKAKKHG